MLAHKLFSHKKTNLNLFESMSESKLVHGSTLNLTKSIATKEKRDVFFNYKIHTDSGLVKYFGKYDSEDFLINCFQNIANESSGKYYSFTSFFTKILDLIR